ncbi:MAG: glycosyltransferase family 39 protein [Sporolactobacillus sp.]
MSDRFRHWRLRAYATRMITFSFLALTTLLVLLNAAFCRGQQSIGQQATLVFKLVTGFIAGCMIIGISLTYQRSADWLKRLPAAHYLLIFLSINFCLQLLVLAWLNVHPSWDFGLVIRLGADQLVKTGYLNDYFTRYTNNIFLALLLAIIGRLLSPSLFFYQLFNCFCLLSAHYLLYRIADRLYGEGTAKLSLLASTLSFPFIFYTPIAYTDTISLPFVLLPLLPMINGQGKLRLDFPAIVGTASLFALCPLVKGTLIILPIAYSIVLLLHLRHWRRIYCLIPLALFFAATILLHLLAYGAGWLNPEQVAENQFPITHWLMMGENHWTNGKYSHHDEALTGLLIHSHSRHQVETMELQETARRIRSRGVTGNLSFFTEKLAITWTDGSFYSLNCLRRFPVRPQVIHALTTGRLSPFTQGVARIELIILIVGLFLSALATRRQSPRPIDFFLQLTLIGIFFFLLIWETRSRYLVSFLPYFILLSISGYRQFSCRANSERL